MLKPICFQCTLSLAPDNIKGKGALEINELKLLRNYLIHVLNFSILNNKVLYLNSKI